MEDQQSNTTQPEHLRIEMTTFRPPEQPTKQVGPFPGSAKRLSTNSQRSDREFDGHQVVRNIPPIQDDAMHEIVITSGIDRSPVASGSGQSTAQEWPQLFHRDILDVQDAGCETYFLEMRELKSLTEGGESTQVFDRDGLDTKIVSRDSTCDDETTDDESYFLAESELQFHPFSKQGERLHPNETEPPQEFVYSSIRKSKRIKKQKRRTREGSMEVDDEYWRSYLKNDDNTSELSFPEQGVSEPKRPRRHLTKPELTEALVHSIPKSKPFAKQHRTTAGESTEVDGEYWRRNYMDNDDITLEQSSLEQGLPEPKRQWYRSKKMRQQNFCSPSRSNPVNFELILFVTILIIFFAFVLFWMYAWYTSLTNSSDF